MNAAAWRSEADPDALLQFLRGKASDRKFRLYACACCRRVWHLLRDARSKAGVVAAEQWADAPGAVDLIGPRLAAEAAASHFAARDAHAEFLVASQAVASAADSNVARGAAYVGNQAAEAISYYAVRQRPWPDLNTARQARLIAKTEERRRQADLLRDMFNPFSSAPLAVEWPAAVLDLARSLYQGEDCHFALHDALLEAGTPSLAEHFATPGHVKGCWGLDAILGNEPPGSW